MVTLTETITFSSYYNLLNSHEFQYYYRVQGKQSAYQCERWSNLECALYKNQVIVLYCCMLEVERNQFDTWHHDEVIVSSMLSKWDFSF